MGAGDPVKDRRRTEGGTDGGRDGRGGGWYSKDKGVSFDLDLFNRDKRE